VNVTNDCECLFNDDEWFEYKQIPISDTAVANISKHFDEIGKYIHEQLTNGKHVLVHCKGGRSRSATMIISFLMKYHSMSLKDAYHFTKARRNIIAPNLGFWKQLVAYEQQIYGASTVTLLDTPAGLWPDIIPY